MTITIGRERTPRATAASSTQDHRGGRLRRRREERAAYLFLAPSLIFFGIFILLPTFFAIYLSLSKWGGFDISQIKFAGLGNYLQVLGPKSIFLAPVLVNTLIFTVITVVLSVVGGLAVAYAVSRLRFQGFWRFLYFLPFVATVVAIGNVWLMMYQPAGLINGLLNLMHVNSVGFLSDPNIALPSVAVVQAWSSIGVAVLILAAGLSAIDTTYYEAAELDGANTWQLFWKITLPLLKPSLLFVLITQIIAGFQSFALIIVMAPDGGPANATNVAAFDMFQEAFHFGAWGQASAMAMILFAIILVITLVQLRFSKSAFEEER